MFTLLKVFANSKGMQCGCPMRKEKNMREILEICELLRNIVGAENRNSIKKQNVNSNMVININLFYSGGGGGVYNQFADLLKSHSVIQRRAKIPHFTAKDQFPQLKIVLQVWSCNFT